MTQLCVNAVLVTNDNQPTEEVKKELLSLQKLTLEEAGCIRFEILQDHNAPERFTLWEIWISQEALDVHLKAPYTQCYLDKGLTSLDHIEKLHLLSQ